MNKFKLFPLALAAFAFSACTSEDAVDNNNQNGEGVKSYIAVNLNNVGANGTRADQEFENGTQAENHIEKVRFYFFTQNGDAYKMTDGTNFKEITPVTGDGKNEPNVERITDAMLVIEGTTKTAPYSMVAVVNPETIENGVLSSSMTKAQVEAAVAKQNFQGNEGNAANFVMTSSVYVSEGAKTWTADISGHVATTADAAKADPVDLYVERVAAKLTSTASGATKDITKGDDTFKAFEVGETTSGKKVYAKIAGWGLADESKEANLIKKIDASWTDDALGFTAVTNPWNMTEYKRCFWESSIAFTAGKRAWEDFATSIDKVYYTLPNTTAKPVYVAAAQLVYEDGTAAEICSYKGVEYLSENDVKNVILNENKKFMKKTGNNEEGTTYESLSAADIKFVVDADKSYEVRAKLADGVTVYVKNGDAYEEANDAANTALGKDAAQIRKDGMTYYYTGVKHLGAKDKTAEFGLVRNHFYKIDVTKITGFGTPVYDKTSDFVPVTPEEVKTYLAARINVLSWRVVNNSVELK